MAKRAKQVLLVDDEEKLLRSIAQRMEVLGFTPFTATSGTAAIEIVKETLIDLAIVDLKMPDMDGLVTIAKLKEIHPDLRTILLTGYGSEKIKQATEALHSEYFEKDEMGDFWHFIKSLNGNDRIVVIRPPSDGYPATVAGNAPLAEQTVKRDESRFPGDTPHLIQHRKPAEPDRNATDEDRLLIVGATPAMQELRGSIERVAQLNCPVMLHGEKGVGKELAARMIHAGTNRKNGRFLAINCTDFNNPPLAAQLLGNQNEDLVEAIRSGNGIFGAGPVGTILFDQIENMPINIQRQLIDMLDRNNNSPHSAYGERVFDIRFLAATSRDLKTLVETKKLLGELHERLKLFELHFPPLRERKDDIAPLCQYFFDCYRKKFGKPLRSISREVIDIFSEYDFPGNVRELEYLVERAVISADGETIQKNHLPHQFLRKKKPDRPAKPRTFPTLAEIETRHIKEVLAATNGNKSKSAEILGISRAALWRKLKQIPSEDPDQDR